MTIYPAGASAHNDQPTFPPELQERINTEIPLGTWHTEPYPTKGCHCIYCEPLPVSIVIPRPTWWKIGLEVADARWEAVQAKGQQQRDGKEGSFEQHAAGVMAEIAVAIWLFRVGAWNMPNDWRPTVDPGHGPADVGPFHVRGNMRPGRQLYCRGDDPDGIYIHANPEHVGLYGTWKVKGWAFRDEVLGLGKPKEYGSGRQKVTVLYLPAEYIHRTMPGVLP